MSYIACQCDTLTYAQYQNAVMRLSELIRIAPSFGAAVGLVFRETHPEIPQTAENSALSKQRCGDCTPHIGRAIMEQEARPKAEFDQWHERFTAKMNKCTSCPNVAACANGFDFLTPKDSNQPQPAC